MCSVPEHFGKFSPGSDEKSIYRPLIDYLFSTFEAVQRSRFGHSKIAVQDVSSIPDEDGGKWTRPDVAAVLVRRNRYGTSPILDLLSFEVKLHERCDLDAVHETLAHRRFAHSAYLVWNRPKCTCDDRLNYARIIDNCGIYGLGLITVHDPENLQTFEVALSPERSELTDEGLDRFIETRFSESNKARIMEALTKFCRGPL